MEDDFMQIMPLVAWKIAGSFIHLLFLFIKILFLTPSLKYESNQIQIWYFPQSV